MAIKKVISLANIGIGFTLDLITSKLKVIPSTDAGNSIVAGSDGSLMMNVSTTPRKVVRVSTLNYTVLASDCVIHLVAGFTGTVTLPTVAASVGRMLFIANHSGANRLASIAYRTSSAAPTTVLTSNAEVCLMSDGTEWFTITN